MDYFLHLIQPSSGIIEHIQHLFFNGYSKIRTTKCYIHNKEPNELVVIHGYKQNHLCYLYVSSSILKNLDTYFSLIIYWEGEKSIQLVTTDQYLYNICITFSISNLHLVSLHTFSSYIFTVDSHRRITISGTNDVDASDLTSILGH